MEKPFKQLWHELCKLGWKARPPLGLCKDHRYVRPGKSGQGVEAIDFFTGEDALKKYGWMQFGIPVAATESAAAASISAAATTSPPAPGTTTPAALVTAVTLWAQRVSTERVGTATSNFRVGKTSPDQKR
ncbi:unnamed protein product [Phytophthora fragariaefolia]|uniref:Unnamed protein product n=1 Tax=Phytophthora fragariaefolia TaxID=1490495 RepID=A0A9W6U6U7_9STRA|nr:unnamed protein product [Phytophthora fragariaefolia]